MPGQNLTLTANFDPLTDELFTVSFVVVDQQDNSITNAQINFDGTTHAPGVYVFENVNPGEYDYTVTKQGYQTTQGQLSVTNQDVQQEVVLLQDEDGPPNWDPVSNLQYNMNVTGMLQIEDEVFSDDPQDIIGAFVEDECRGVISPMPEHQGLLFLTIGSNQMQGETITFKAYRAETGEIHDLDQSLTFENQLMVGTPADPFIFTFESQENLYQLNIEVNPTNGGSAEGQGSYPQGETVNIAAIAAENFEFSHWSGETQHLEDPHHQTTSLIMPGQNLTLTANFQPLDDEVPENLYISHQAIADGDTECFDALQTISVSDFTVEAGGSAELIAGESIHLLPGTTVEHGGYLLARIAAHEDDYCGIPRATEQDPLASGEEPVSVDPLDQVRKNGFFKLYPNPTEGTINLELTETAKEEHITVEVYDMMGGRIFGKELPPQRQHSLSLEGQQTGMYIIRVTQGEKVGVERLIKR